MAQNTLRDFDFASLQSDPVPGIVAGLEGLRNQGIQDRLLALKEQAAQQAITDQQSIQNILQQQLGGGTPGLTEPQGIVAGEGIVPGDLAITPGGSIGVEPSRVKPFTQSVADTERNLAVGLLGINGGREAFSKLSNVFKTGREDEILAAAQEVEEIQGFALKLDRAKTRKARNKLLEDEQSRSIIDTGQIDPELLRMRNMSDDELQGEIISDLAVGDSLKKLVDNRLLPPKVKPDFTLSAGQQRFDAQGRPIASVAPKVTAPKGFTLGEGQQRFDAQGRPIAQVAPKFVEKEVKPFSEKRFQQEQQIAGAKATTDFNNKIAVESEKLRLAEKSPSGQRTKKLNELKIKAAENRQVLNVAKREMRLDAREVQINVINGRIDKALDIVDTWFASGLLAPTMNFLIPSNAREMESLIKTIQANLSFETLSAMKEASASGGALGAINTRELDLLGSTISNLDIGLPDEVLKDNLKFIKTTLKTWETRLNKERELLGTLNQPGSTGTAVAPTPDVPPPPPGFEVQ